jgi:hypothetical protein
MTRLTKLSEPNVLHINGDVWLQRLLEAITDGDNEKKASIESKYRHPQIKAQLIIETSEKCAYCESLVRHIAFGDVEHIKPKSLFPELCFTWSNLTFACSVCNGNKRSYYSDEEPLINPYVDNLECHLLAAGPWLSHMPGSVTGHITISVLDLNRPELLERRLERLRNISMLADRWSRLPNGHLREIALENLRMETSKEKEYSFVTTSYLQLVGVLFQHPEATISNT